MGPVRPNDRMQTPQTEHEPREKLKAVPDRPTWDERRSAPIAFALGGYKAGDWDRGRRE